MRRRDCRVGMVVRHPRSHKPLGRVTAMTDRYVHLDGESPIATYAEIEPDPSHGRDT